MGINSTEVAYNFGQLGSAYSDGSDALKPPTNKVFVAITMLEDTTFDNTDGLVADIPVLGSDQYIGSAQPANDLASGSETTDEGSGGQVIANSVTFPEGITIYGRWTEIDLNSGKVIAYIGD
tara:strand:+ start:635 stop:1000 length:366 start_codon:yes stop_codon:yes gene_type:complete